MTELELTKCELNMAKAHIKFLNDKIKRRDFIIEELKQKLREFHGYYGDRKKYFILLNQNNLL